MSTPTEPSVSENTYFIDAENAAEMARLITQNRLITKSMGGLFPERTDVSNMHNILDIASGPGGWVLDVACAYPKTQIVGIDTSKLMIQYAHTQAQQQKLNNANFREMDALKPLDFPDSSFDLVNGRLLIAFLPAAAWPKLLQECLRITRPGGVIRLTECEVPITNSLSASRLWTMLAQAFKQAGQSFSPDGRDIGLTPMLGRLLHDAGYVHAQKMAHAIDYSAGTEAHGGFYHDFAVFFKLLQPFLIKCGGTTQEEVDTLYHRALAEMLSEDFCSLWFLLTVWGEKPL